MLAKDGFQASNECLSLLRQGCEIRTPLAAEAADAPKVESQETEGLILRQVYHSAFLLVEFHFQFGQFLAEPLVNRRQQPPLTPVCTDQDDE